MSHPGFVSKNLGTSILRSKSQKSTLAIVILHGHGGDHTALLPLSRKIQKKLNCDVYLYDLRGHGHSEKRFPTNQTNLECVHAHDLQEFLTFHKITNPILIGHCYGSVVIQEYLDKVLSPKPKKTIHLNNLNSLPNIGINRNFWFHQLIRSRQPKKFVIRSEADHMVFKGKSDFDLRRIASDIRSVGGLKRWMTMLFAGAGWKVALNVLDQSTNLILLGKYDMIINPMVNKKTINNITKAQVKLIPSNHIAPLNVSEKIAHEIYQFLENNS